MSLLLAAHIATGVLLIATALVRFLQITARHKPLQTMQYVVAWFGTLLVGSGVALIFVAGAPIGRVCVSATATLGAIAIAEFWLRSYVQKRTSNL